MLCIYDIDYLLKIVYYFTLYQISYKSYNVSWIYFTS
jgi:hypothetical protein